MRPPRETPFPSETKLAEACIRRFRDVGGKVFKVHGHAAQERGQPDLIGCLHGRFVGVELKQPGNAPTSLQMKRLREWAAAGGLAGWARTEVEFVELLEHVDDFEWTNPQLERTEAERGAAVLVGVGSKHSAQDGG